VATFLKEICCDIVSYGGYRLSWVGFAEDDEQKTVRPVAQCGYEDGYLDAVNITWADTERGKGPVGTAIRTGRPVIAKDIPTSQSFAPWRAEAVKRGYASAIALPLISKKRTLGSLNIYAAEPDAFDADEVNLD
jgi:GAF domain-containing protein